MSSIQADSSMRKSVVALSAAALVGAVAAVAAAAWLPRAGVAIALVMALVVAALAAFAAGGHIAIQRQRMLGMGAQDLFLARNEGQSESAILSGQATRPQPLRRWIAGAIFGHPLLVGDTVSIRSLAEIRATLDAEGCLEGLPFMAEMERFCGKTARVFRVLDKVYDYRRSSKMRRLDRAVLLVGLRCEGDAHGGCEAECYLIWKTQWLKPMPSSAALQVDMSPFPRNVEVPIVPGATFKCQYTMLTQASSPQAPLTVRGLVAPWAVGNVATGAWLTAVLTRAFNAFQGWRGGTVFPTRPASGNDKTIMGEPLQRGDWVRIKTPAEIARTLDNNSKNRGLWFDADMLKYCGRCYEVRGRVKQIVDVLSGAMIPMKTPCIIMEEVHYSGEFQGFGEQHDYLYYRESWLQRIEAPTASVHGR